MSEINSIKDFSKIQKKWIIERLTRDRLFDFKVYLLEEIFLYQGEKFISIMKDRALEMKSSWSRSEKEILLTSDLLPKLRPLAILKLINPSF